MDKIICPRCSKGIEIHPDGVVWIPLKMALIDWSETGSPIGILQWYECSSCHYTYFTTTRISDK